MFSFGNTLLLTTIFVAFSGALPVPVEISNSLYARVLPQTVLKDGREFIGWMALNKETIPAMDVPVLQQKTFIQKLFSKKPQPSGKTHTVQVWDDVIQALWRSEAAKGYPLSVVAVIAENSGNWRSVQKLWPGQMGPGAPGQFIKCDHGACFLVADRGLVDFELLIIDASELVQGQNIDSEARNPNLSGPVRTRLLTHFDAPNSEYRELVPFLNVAGRNFAYDDDGIKQRWSPPRA